MNCAVFYLKIEHVWLSVCVFPWEVMQCSAAMDVLFLMDGSYSVGKGSFERAKHYAIKLCQALDVGPDKVPIFSRLLCLFLSSLLVIIIFLETRLCSSLIQVRVGVIQFGSTPRLEFALDSHATKQELKKLMKRVPYRLVPPLVLRKMFIFKQQMLQKFLCTLIEDLILYLFQFSVSWMNLCTQESLCNNQDCFCTVWL